MTKILGKFKAEPSSNLEHLCLAGALNLSQICLMGCPATWHHMGIDFHPSEIKRGLEVEGGVRRCDLRLCPLRPEAIGHFCRKGKTGFLGLLLSLGLSKSGTFSRRSLFFLALFRTCPVLSYDNRRLSSS